jgi:hypothetical protein
MAFDPDAYLQKKGFDPDAYLKASEQKALSRVGPESEPGKLESLARGAAQGVTLGNADELTALIESLATNKPYDQAREESRANYKAAEEANPLTTAAGNLAGGFATALIPGVGEIGLGKGIAGAAKVGAAYGAANALGTSEQDMTKPTLDNVGNLAAEMTEGAVGGGLYGGATSAAIKGLGKTAEYFGGTSIGQKAKEIFKYAKEDPEFYTKDSVIKRAKVNEGLSEEIQKLADKDPSALVDSTYEAAKAATVIPDLDQVYLNVVGDVVENLKSTKLAQPVKNRIMGKVVEIVKDHSDVGKLDADVLLNMQTSFEQQAEQYKHTKAPSINPNANEKIYNAYKTAADGIDKILKSPSPENAEAAYGYKTAAATRNLQGDLYGLLANKVETENASLDAQKTQKQNILTSIFDKFGFNEVKPHEREAMRFSEGLDTIGQFQGSLEKQQALDNKIANIKESFHKQNLLMEAGAPGSNLASNPGNYFKAGGLSAKGQILKYSAIAGNVTRGLGNYTNRVINMPVKDIKDAAEALTKAGSVFGNVLSAAADKPDSVRKGIMFTLMQQPAFREHIKQHVPEDESQK